MSRQWRAVRRGAGGWTHGRLRHGGPAVEDDPCLPQNLEDGGVVVGKAVDVGTIRAIDSAALKVEMLFEADRKTVERADRTAMAGEVVVELLGALESIVWEQLSHTVDLELCIR